MSFEYQIASERHEERDQQNHQDLFDLDIRITTDGTINSTYEPTQTLSVCTQITTITVLN